MSSSVRGRLYRRGMAVGQQVLSGVASLERLRAAEDDLGSVVADEGAVHVRKLQAVLALHREHEADGRALSAVPEAARFLRCSEWRANRLLDEGLFLTALPGALDAICVRGADGGAVLDRGHAAARGRRPGPAARAVAAVAGPAAPS